ncbi:MAG: PAS domain S-box protein [Chloroflexi bacterium]|nr:PAS domain S-box protein [Chloroflexota bacterium]
MKLIRIRTLQWTVGAFCTLLGTMLLVIPHQFYMVLSHPLKYWLPVWGVLFLGAGIGLVVIAAVTTSRQVVTIFHLLAGGLLLVLAAGSYSDLEWVYSGNYVVIGLGTILAGFLPRAWVRTRSLPGHVDLLAIVIGMVGVTNGVLILAFPDQFNSMVYPAYYSFYIPYGFLFLGSGSLLIVSQFQQMDPPRLKFLQYIPPLFAGLVFFSFIAAIHEPYLNWPGFVFYGGFGAAIILLPWVSAKINTFSPLLLRTRVAMMLAAVAALPLIFTVALVSSREEALVLNQAMERQKAIANTLMKSLSSYIDLHRSAVFSLSRRPQLMELDRQELQDILNRYHNTFPEVTAFSLYTEDGQLYLSSSPGQVRNSLAGQPVYDNARATLQPSLDIDTSPASKEKEFIFAAPAQALNGAFSGLVVVSIPTRQIADFLEEQSAGVEDLVYLVDKQGKAIAHPRYDQENSFTDLSAQEPVSSILATQSSNGSFTFQPADSERLVGYSQQPETGWMIVVEDPSSRSLSGVYAGRNLAALILSGVLIVTAGLGFALASWLTGPLGALAYAAQELAAGNPSVPLPQSLITEINQLATVFGQMRDGLTARTTERDQVEQALRASELLFRTLADTTSAAIFIVQDGQIIFANPSAGTITGYKTAQLIDMEFSRLAHLDDRPYMEQYNDPQAVEVNLNRHELRLITREGEIRWIDLSVGKILMHEHTAWVFTAFDITERNQAERALRKAKAELEDRVKERTAELQAAVQRLETVLANLPVGVWIADATGRIIQTNRMANVVWGGDVPLSNHIHDYKAYKGWWANTGQQLKPEDWALARAITQGETSFGNVIDILRFDGQVGTLLNSAAPIHDERHHIVGAVAVSQDITQQRRLEQQAQQAAAEAQLRAEEINTIINAMAEAVIIYGAQGEIVRVNPAAVETFGFDPTSETFPQAASELNILYHDGRMVASADLPSNRALAGSIVRGERYHITSKTGREFVILVSASPLYKDGQINGAVAIWHDVTDREHLLDLLQFEQARFKAIIENAPEGIILVDKTAKIVLANLVAERLLARPIPYDQDYHSLAQLQLCDADGTYYDPSQLPFTRSVLEGKSFTNVEMAIRWPDGQQHSLLMNTTPIFDAAGAISGAIAVFQDVTERLRAAEEIARTATQIEVQHRLSQQRDEERAQIARDLHDGPVQELIALTFDLSDLRDMTRESGLLSKIADMNAFIQRQIRNLREYSSELRPPSLVHFGLEKAIRSHAEKFQETHPGIRVYLNLMPDAHLVQSDVRTALFRIYQESLNNILRHSQAKQVWIRLSLEDTQIVLEIHDDGCGFKMPDNWIELVREGHLGLVGAKERAEAVGGRLEVTSNPDAGTTLQVIVPWEKPA